MSWYLEWTRASGAQGTERPREVARKSWDQGTIGEASNVPVEKINVKIKHYIFREMNILIEYNYTGRKDNDEDDLNELRKLRSRGIQGNPESEEVQEE